MGVFGHQASQSSLSIFTKLFCFSPNRRIASSALYILPVPYGAFSHDSASQLHRGREIGYSSSTPHRKDAHLGRLPEGRHSADPLLPVAEEALRGGRRRL